MTDKFEAKLDQVAGSVKETAGKLTGDKKLEAEGAVDQLAGKVKEGLANATDAIKGAIDSLSN